MLMFVFLSRCIWIRLRCRKIRRRGRDIRVRRWWRRIVRDFAITLCYRRYQGDHRSSDYPWQRCHYHYASIVRTSRSVSPACFDSFNCSIRFSRLPVICFAVNVVPDEDRTFVVEKHMRCSSRRSVQQPVVSLSDLRCHLDAPSHKP
jgi:hypothetical protein